MRHSQDKPGRRAFLDAGAGGVRPRDRDRAPSNPVRSRCASRSTQISPPPTPAEVLARVQLLLDFPLLRRSSTNGEPPSEALSASPTKMSRSRRDPRTGVLTSRCMMAVGGPETLQPRCTPPPRGRDNSHRPVDPTSVTMFPQRHPTREAAATNVKSFGNGPRKTLELPSNDDGRRAISKIGVRGLLWTTRRRGPW